MKTPTGRKFFNISGPCDPARHYMLSAVDRLPAVRALVDEGHYFVVHSARQSGKTTLLRSLAHEINTEGRSQALYCSLEALQGFDDPDNAIKRIVALLGSALEIAPDPSLQGLRPDVGGLDAVTMLRMALTRLCKALSKPLVLLFDETDCLSGQTLVTFLRQLRDGYVNRDIGPFPWSLALVGMRDIRDFKANVRSDRETLGSASPFNIVTEAMTLTNFSPEEISRLYQQHTDATGQVFEPSALERVAYWTEGQPWLVNALARQVVEKDLKGDTTQSVTTAHIDAAADTLMKRRDTHIDSLLERLKEPRVRRVIEPMLFGGTNEVSLLDDDTRFCLDLGLVAPDGLGQLGTPMGLRPANPIYRDVMVRTLGADTVAELPAMLERRWLGEGRLDMTGLLKAFQEFWRENAEMWVERYDYKEAAPHLILQAFLQRVVNGGAHIEREFALGRGRVDLCVEYGNGKYPVEIKLAGSKAREDGLVQTAGYMERCGAREGWLVIIDRDPKKMPGEKITWTTESVCGDKIIHLVGC